VKYHNNKSVEREIILDTDELFPKLSRVQLVALRAEIELGIMMKEVGL